jgi:glycosyltransferase involved in cell wall biosynthesis
VNTSANPSRESRFSLVVPVWNEAANIGSYCSEAVRQLGREGYELLVCYDRDDDNTLPALAVLPPEQKPAVVRLIKNDLGRGVRYAIEAGMRAAQAPVVVVMMADASDDFQTVPQLAELVEQGADVACASRYAPGGAQIGGPLLKRCLSRTAGWSLHWLAGLPTRDPTNSFKGYSRRFLEQTRIESTAGFCLGLELTVKAHCLGGKVCETPTVWRDRTAGTSRFRLFRWLPMYLRWYLWAIRKKWFGGGRRLSPS